MEIRVGTSGWTYPHWRRDFYPAGLTQKRELGYLADRMGSVEINGSFYSLQRPTSYAAWRASTPDHFVFAVKGGRFITHNKKLRNARQSLANFLASGPLALGAKLGPFLWQLPPMLPYSRERLSDFFELIPHTVGRAQELAAECDEKAAAKFGDRPQIDCDLAAAHGLRHCVEVRHPSYECEDFYSLCRQFGVAIVLADTARRWPWIEQHTANFVYFRLHGSRELYVSGYTDEEIDAWAHRIHGWTQAPGLSAIHVYFDNDYSAHAAWDAVRLQDRLRQLALL